MKNIFDSIRSFFKDNPEPYIDEVEIAKTRLLNNTASQIMTPSEKIIWIDIDSDLEALKKAVLQNQYWYYPVCKGDLDHIQGIINSDVLLAAFISDKKIKIRDLMHKPLFIPEDLKAIQIMKLFKKEYIHMGVVIDEYAKVKGLVTVTDVLESIVGIAPPVINDHKKEIQIIQKNSNTWDVDGLISTNEFKEYFKLDALPGEKTNMFNTIGGFVMHRLGRVPVVGDRIELYEYKIEVDEMDGNRVSQVRVTEETPLL